MNHVVSRRIHHARIIRVLGRWRIERAEHFSPAARRIRLLLPEVDGPTSQGVDTNKKDLEGLGDLRGLRLHMNESFRLGPQLGYQAAHFRQRILRQLLESLQLGPHLRESPKINHPDRVS